MFGYMTRQPIASADRDSSHHAALEPFVACSYDTVLREYTLSAIHCPYVMDTNLWLYHSHDKLAHHAPVLCRRLYLSRHLSVWLVC